MNKAVEYHGYRSVREYERECARVGFQTRRVPFQKGGETYFVLITSPPRSGSSIEAWALFTIDENLLIMEGVINGFEGNYLDKLADNGYHLTKTS